MGCLRWSRLCLSHTTLVPYTSAKHSVNTAWNACTVLPKSAEKESGPGQSCMTNPPLTPSVLLSTSKDKSRIECKHWIFPYDYANHLCWIHNKTLRLQKNQTTVQLKLDNQLLAVSWNRNGRAMWKSSACSVKAAQDVWKSIRLMQGDL